MSVMLLIISIRIVYIWSKQIVGLPHFGFGSMSHLTFMNYMNLSADIILWWFVISHFGKYRLSCLKIIIFLIQTCSVNHFNCQCSDSQIKHLLVHIPLIWYSFFFMLSDYLVCSHTLMDDKIMLCLTAK